MEVYVSKWVIVLAWLAGCAGEGKDDTGGGVDSPADTSETADPNTDADNDGVVAADDCDDGNPAAYPGATEVCDGVDNDCDSAIDEDITDLPTWYEDHDLDSFGNPLVGEVGCEAPAGYVPDNTDCDDQHGAVHPGASELCNEIDEDCDGAMDDNPADGEVWFTDADTDGHGDPESTYRACGAPTGAGALGDDCDDADPTSFPGAPDYPNDGVDQDCNGTDHCAAPTWVKGDYALVGGAASAEAAALCTVPDIAISGSLTIDSTGFTDLSALACLCEVSSDLLLTSNPALTSLAGLEGLGWVGGSLRIEDNGGLSELAGLAGLQQVDGDLAIEHNGAIVALTGFPSLTTVGGTLSVASEPSLESISGFSALADAGALSVSANGELVDLVGFAALTELRGALYIGSNTALPDLWGMGALSHVGGDAEIYWNDQLSSLHGLEGLATVEGDLLLNQDGDLASVAALTALTSVGGTLRIYYNDSLVNLGGLDQLTTVGELDLENLSALTSTAGIEALGVITGDLTLQSNVSLTDLSGLIGLTTVGDDVYIRDLDALRTLAGLDSLRTVGSDLRLYNNDVLDDVSGLYNVDTIGGYLVVQGNTSLPDATITVLVAEIPTITSGTVISGNGG